MDINDLKKPFPAKSISWRVGRKTKKGDKAVPFAYIDARDVMDRLDEVCGMEGWQCRYPFHNCCEISVKVGDEWIVKANMAGDTQIEAVKGGASDAFKRAAVLWGIGSYLYKLPNTWWPVGQFGFEKEVIVTLTGKLDAWQKKYFEDK